MTISTAAALAREGSRERDGQFGKQEHTAPELALDPATAVDNACAAYHQAANDAKAANVAWAAAHMPEHIKGVRFIRRDEDVIPALFIPSTPGGHVAGAGEYTRDFLFPVPSYIALRSDLVVLDEIVEENGNPAWEWCPTAEQRAVTPEDASTERAATSKRFSDAGEKFHELAAAYLRQEMPAGADRVIIAHGPEVVDGRYVSVPQIIEAYDADGDPVPLNVHAEENAGYVRTVAQFGFGARGHFPHGITETGATEYIISREA